MQTHPLFYILFLAGFMQQWQSWVVVTETICSSQLKIFIIWLSIQKSLLTSSHHHHPDIKYFHHPQKLLLTSLPTPSLPQTTTDLRSDTFDSLCLSWNFIQMESQSMYFPVSDLIPLLPCFWDSSTLLCLAVVLFIAEWYSTMRVMLYHNLHLVGGYLGLFLVFSYYK